MAADEIRDPDGVIPRAFAWGVVAFLFLYAGAQSRLFFALPFEERLFLVEALPDPAIKKRNGRDPRYDPRNGEEF